MAMRRCAAGMVEASSDASTATCTSPLLRTALERHVATGAVGADCNTQDVSAA